LFVKLGDHPELGIDGRFDEDHGFSRPKYVVRPVPKEDVTRPWLSIQVSSSLEPPSRTHLLHIGRIRVTAIGPELAVFHSQ
jgi:hypothetical protein